MADGLNNDILLCALVSKLTDRYIYFVLQFDVLSQETTWKPARDLIIRNRVTLYLFLEWGRPLHATPLKF